MTGARLDHEQIARSWYAAWNLRDLRLILKLYADDVHFTSPYIRTVGFSESGTILSKADLARYFELGLSRIPDLHFEPVGTCIGVTGHTLVYRNQAQTLVAESHEFNEQALIIGVNAAYAGSAA